MKARTREASPGFRGRGIGIVYLLFFLTAILGEFFTQRAGIGGFGVPDDAATIASELIQHEAVFRLGFALSLISLACYVAVTALFYQLLHPVNSSLAMVALCFSLMGQALAAVGSLFQLAPLVLLGGNSYLNTFTVYQLQTLALLFLHLHMQIGSIGLFFDGLFLFLIGYLMLKSPFLPRILGALVAFAGVGWLTVLVPPLANFLSTPVEVLGFLAEVSLMLWLLVKGVPVQRGREQASTGVESIPAELPRATRDSPPD